MIITSVNSETDILLSILTALKSQGVTRQQASGAFKALGYVYISASKKSYAGGYTSQGAYQSQTGKDILRLGLALQKKLSFPGSTGAAALLKK